GVMFVGALIPSVSSIAVVTRSVAYGFVHGAFVSVGIVLGDITFILIAIFGLSILVDLMGNLFFIIRYLGGAYLVWLGIVLWRSKTNALDVESISESSLISSLLTGLIITLGDQKAILFYFSFFPAIFDLLTITYVEITGILFITIIAVGGAKLCYAYMANRASSLIKNTKAIKIVNITAASVMMGVGLFIIMMV
ncbi:MAG: LysE family translocator, partial [Thiohalomonadales bacterium]